MALETKIIPYEILIRFNPDGTFRAAHKCNLVRTMDGDEVIAEVERPAEAVAASDLSGLFPEPEQIIEMDRLAKENVKLFDLEGEVRSLNERMAATKAANELMKARLIELGG